MIDEDVVRLRAAVGRISRRIDRQASDEGRPRTQLSILATVATRGRIGAGELAEIEGINPTMLSRILGRLQEEGLVRRIADPHDRRSVLVEITASGTRFHNKLRRARTKLLTDTLRSLDPREVDALIAALPALEALAEALLPLPPRRPTPEKSGRAEPVTRTSRLAVAR